MRELDQVWAWLLWLRSELPILTPAIRDAPAPHLAMVIAGTLLIAMLELLFNPRKPRTRKLWGSLARFGAILWAWLRPHLTWILGVRFLRLGGLVVFSVIVFGVAYALLCLTIFFSLLGVLGLQGRNWPAYALIALVTAYAVFAWRQIKAIALPSHNHNHVGIVDSDLKGWLGMGSGGV